MANSLTFVPEPCDVAATSQAVRGRTSFYPCLMYHVTVWTFARIMN